LYRSTNKYDCHTKGIIFIPEWRERFEIDVYLTGRERVKRFLNGCALKQASLANNARQEEQQQTSRRPLAAAAACRSTSKTRKFVYCHSLDWDSISFTWRCHLRREALQ
jgi:hypothetical protein